MVLVLTCLSVPAFKHYKHQTNFHKTLYDHYNVPKGNRTPLNFIILYLVPTLQKTRETLNKYCKEEELTNEMHK
jgi:hypothetical protein